MLIEPDTYIRLIDYCPLDNTYEHTIYFESYEKQQEYFKDTLVGVEFSKQSYQRYDRGVLHLQTKAENLEACNYLMFQNSAFGDKYFYAFVTSVEYVNNVSCRIYYELDVMQTWYFDYWLQECYVEREHSETDNIGDNLVPENLETGEYTYSPVVYGEESARVTPFTSFKIGILSSIDSEFNNVAGGYYYSTYSGLTFLTFERAEDANTFIKSVVDDNKASAIVAIFMIPEEFDPGAPTIGLYPGGTAGGLLEYVKKNLTSIDGYTDIKNNKLFTMPYNSLLVTDHDGKSATYGYEYFYNYPSVVDNDYVALNVRSAGASSPEYCILPWFYKGLFQNHLERVTITSVPQCAYNIDTFRMWLAQNKAGLAIDTATSIAGLIGGTMAISEGAYIGSGKLVSAGGQVLSNSFNNITNNVKQVLQHSTLPATAKGNIGTGALNINNGIFGFSLYYCTIRAEYAKIIDDYFNMFGYATHRVKKPNVNKRPHWNYVKTGNCVLRGSVPANVASKICSIYNNGVTFWRKGSEVGDYSLDNRPV